MKSVLKVIINADDLGASLGINDAIFGSMARRRVTSATMLANGGAIDDAVARSREFPECSFGVHLNLTEFRPLTTVGLSPLTDADGCFAKGAIRSLPLNRAIRTAIFTELSAQIELLLDHGVPVSHIDSHHHIHTIPALFGVIKALQARFGIKKVRCSMNLYPTPHSKALLFKKFVWNYLIRHYQKSLTTDGFTSFAFFNQIAGSMKTAPMTIELMTHPGAQAYAEETALLTSDWMTKVPYELTLINYNQLRSRYSRNPA